MARMRVTDLHPFELSVCPEDPNEAMKTIERFIQTSAETPEHLFITPTIYRALVGYALEDDKIAVLKRRYPGMKIECAYLQSREGSEDIGLMGRIEVDPKTHEPLNT